MRRGEDVSVFAEGTWESLSHLVKDIETVCMKTQLTRAECCLYAAGVLVKSAGLSPQQENELVDTIVEVTAEIMGDVLEDEVERI